MAGSLVNKGETMYKRTVKVPLYNTEKTTLLRCPESFKGVFEIPRGITSVGPKAFYGCNRLTGVKIPSSVLVIGSRAFMDCSELSFVEFEKGSQVASIGAAAFYGCEKLTEITIPERVTQIEPQTFYNCTYLTSVVMSDDITIIGAEAFFNCPNLKTISLPTNLVEIKQAAFRACASLKEVFVPDSVENIHARAFDNCVNLLKVLFGVNSQLKRIGQEAFRNCDRLARVYIPDGVVSIEKHAFWYCDSLKSLFIPAWINAIDAEIASMCNMDFSFFCEAEPSSRWHEDWNRMGGYIAAGQESLAAPTTFNTPRWWYEKFVAPQKISENLVRVSSNKPDFDKEKIKEFIFATDKTLYCRTDWAWSGTGREEVSKEKVMEILEGFDFGPGGSENYVEIKEYEDSVLVNTYIGLPF